MTKDLPYEELMREKTTDVLADGGFCLAAPDGSWIIAPFTDEEKHYLRPDVYPNRERQCVIK